MFAKRLKICYYRLIVFSLYSLFLVPCSVKAEVPIVAPDLSQPTGIAPAYFGPNAFPVPEMTDGRTNSHLRLEAAADSYLGYQHNRTADIFAKINI